jgi:hypothetical protein
MCLHVMGQTQEKGGEKLLTAAWQEGMAMSHHPDASILLCYLALEASFIAS